jgi:hypothetical protein
MDLKMVLRRLRLKKMERRLLGLPLAVVLSLMVIKQLLKAPIIQMKMI